VEESHFVARGLPAAASPLAQSTLLGELADGARVGVLAINGGRYVAANQYACELLGYPRDELIGNRVDAPHWDGGAGEARVTRRDGSLLDIEYRVVESAVGGMLLMLGLFWPA
jgi:PAS domain-containing protein